MKDYKKHDYKTTWMTKEGEELKPSEMSTQHLINALNMLMRVAKKTAKEAAIKAQYNDQPFTSLELWAVSHDLLSLREICIMEFPVAKLMEEEVLRRIEQAKTDTDPDPRGQNLYALLQLSLRS